MVRSHFQDKRAQTWRILHLPFSLSLIWLCVYIYICHYGIFIIIIMYSNHTFVQDFLLILRNPTFPPYQAPIWHLNLNIRLANRQPQWPLVNHGKHSWIYWPQAWGPTLRGRRMPNFTHPAAMVPNLLQGSCKAGAHLLSSDRTGSTRQLR